MAILIADSGATKCEWCLTGARKKLTVVTQGMSPYFLTAGEMEQTMRTELLPALKRTLPEAVYFYGTGCTSAGNVTAVRKALKRVFPAAEIFVTHDLLGATRALCGEERGVACILGTGSNSCYFNGKRIVRNSSGLGYVLGDEGSGAYLGKLVLQHYLNNVFEEDIKQLFDTKYRVSPAEIIENVYKKPLPNRYLASFTPFLSENRGHYMVENIIADGLNDFFFRHIACYPESSRYPVHFTGSVAFYFRDAVLDLCNAYGFRPGSILRTPMEGLIRYHSPR